MNTSRNEVNLLAWSDAEDGTFYLTNSLDGEYTWPQPEFEAYGNPEASYDEGVPQNNIYYAATSYYWSGVRDTGLEYARLMSLNVKTQVKLWTGGKAIVQRQSLFGIQCQASELKQPVMDFSAGIDVIGQPWVATDAPWPSDLAYQWNSEPSAPIDPAKLTVLGKHPGADGNLWLALPDNSVQDITITTPGIKHFSAGATATKYLSHFEVFVRQPWPKYPNYPWDPTGNCFDPDAGWPPGYPKVFLYPPDAGHAWWKLTCDASCDAIKPQFTTANCSLLLGGTGWGYGPDQYAQVIHWNPYEKQGPGHIYAGDNSQTVHRIYACGFQNPGLIDALDYTDWLSSNLGMWDSSTHNCVHEVVNAGNKAGVALPPDRLPEYFGYHLPPDNP